MKRIVIFVTLLFAFSKLFSQGIFTVKHYNMNDGLAHSMTKDVIQDTKGYIWLGTWNGVDKFDGYSFRNFKSYPQDKVKLPSNRIEGLSMSAEDNLWVRTYGQQLFFFNQKTESFEDIFDKKQHPLINSVKCLENGITWAIAEGFDLYRIDERNYRKPDGIRFFGRANYPYLGKTIYEIFLDSDGDEWILSDKGVTIEGKKKISNNIPFQYIVEVNGKIYLASQNGYLATYASNGQLQTVNIPLNFERINRLKKLDDEQIAIVTPNVIVIYNTKEKTTQSFSPPKGDEFIASEKLFCDSQGVLWTFASGGKIIRYDAKNNEYQTLHYPDFPPKQLLTGFAFFFYEDDFGDIWILLREGILCYYNTDKQQLEMAYYNDAAGNRSYYTVSARNYMIDSHNNLWITSKDGVDQLSFSKKAYERIVTSPNEEARAVFQDKYNRLWLGIKNGKIELYDKSYNYIGNLSNDGRVVSNNNVIFGANIYCFRQDSNGRIWVGSRDKGLFILHPENENKYRVTQYQPSNNPYSISSKSIYSIFEDSQGRMWIGCHGGGLNLVETSAKGNLQFIHAGNKLKNFPIGRGNMVRYIYQSKNGVMMIGTSNGLITFSSKFDSPEDITFFHNFCKADRDDCLSNSDVLHIFQDKNSNIYVSTFSGGVDITSDSPELLSEEIRFKNINKTNGLISDLSLSVIEDKKGFIWIASIHAFSRLNPTTKEFDHFSQDNLKIPFSVSEATPIIDHENNLIFGTANGALRILLEQIQHSRFVPPIVFTGISVQKKGQKRTDEFIQIDSPVLSPDQRNITIQFSALDYTNTETINYAYRLKDDKKTDWIYIGKNRSVDFINLPAGEYIFQVKSTNSDGVWMDNITSLRIVVKPTFWETGFAWLIYIIAFILLVLLIVYIITYIFNLRRRVDIEQELTNLKLKFFTDISHELRTPLTLITSPVEEVISSEELSDNGKENMLIVKHNADRMLKLINQILDFRKIQNNKMRVYLEQTDVIPFTKKIFQSFSSMAHQMQIFYTHQIEDNTSLVMYTDTDKIEKILFNLLSNAFKHTPSGCNITLLTKVENNNFLIQVKDEGSGFDIRKVDSLFKRFETNNDANPNISSGIGLSLVKELVNLLHGKIEVESTIGVGSTFSVRLPMNCEIFATDQNIELILNDTEKCSDSAEDEVLGQTNKTTTVLIIEDNDELRYFIKKVLSPDYNVLEASNGKIGLELTIKTSPDIVISDIMMPEMDGIEYLNLVKNNHEVSHIPVILLTAKSSIDDQIKGMEYGADDYITKPFSSSYLKTKIASLIKQREQLWEYYTSKQESIKVQIQPSNNWEPSVPKITSYDDQFICKVIQSIEDNIEKTDFRIDTMAESLNMSRPVFYRKIKSIIGLSPIDFVKKIRIKRAIQLLESNQYSIAEVAYQSGFTTPQYLSKVFKEVTGYSPTEYLQNQQKSK